MKRILAMLIAVLLLLTACNDSNKKVETVDESDAFFSYSLGELTAFTVDSDSGLIYAALHTEDGSVIDLCEVSIDGERSNTYTIPSLSGWIYQIAAGDGVVYLASNNADDNALYGYTPETDTLETILSLDGFENIKKIAYSDGKIYILAVDSAYIGAEYDLWEGTSIYSRYSYDGTVLKSYDIGSGELAIVHDELTNSFAINPDGTIMIHAYDSIGGFYFAKLDPETLALGEKAYRDINTIESFASDGTDIIYFSINGSALASYNTLCYTSTDSSAIADIMPNVLVSRYDRIYYADGFTYYLNSLSGEIERIKNAVYIRENKPVKIITPAKYSTDIFSAGYTFEISNLSSDEFALTVLSRDKMYDICYVNTRLDFASNIKDQGSFYPLNDVPGVAEYIDALFPFIKDAATDKNGNIWMIPIGVNVSTIVYNEENCMEAGMDFSKAMTAIDVMENVRLGASADTSGTNYNFNQYSLMQKSLISYLRNNTTLDTDEFRALAAEIKEFMSEKDRWGSDLAVNNPNYIPPDGEMFNPEFLFDSSESRLSQTAEYIIGRNDISVLPITGMGSTGSAECIFLCVNPDSENLADTLKYITAVCEYIMTLRNSYLLADKATYTDSDYAMGLYELYESSVIDFNISNEIVMDDFNKYLNDEITLDEMISEADRKLAMYLGE